MIQERTIALLIALCFLGFSACAPKTERKPPVHPVQESYMLLDQGKNSKAILLLEAHLAKNPDDKEAHLLLASAMIGFAGIHIYSIYDGFKDVLFSKPLVDGISSSRAKPSEDLNVRMPTLPTVSKDNTEFPPAVQLINGLDSFLGGLRSLMSYLNRFPMVNSHGWPVLEKAIEHLNAAETEERSKDIQLYRTFVRLTHVRSFIVERWMARMDWGTFPWICSLEMKAFYKEMMWVGRQFELMTRDLKKVFPNQKSTIEELELSAAQIKWVLNDFEVKQIAQKQAGLPAPETLNTLEPNKTLVTLQREIRGLLKCVGN